MAGSGVLGISKNLLGNFGSQKNYGGADCIPNEPVFINSDFWIQYL